MTKNTQPTPSNRTYEKRLSEKANYEAQSPYNILNEAYVFNIAFSLEEALTAPTTHADAMAASSKPKTLRATAWLKRSYLALKNLSL